jgi:hypothetical protein
MSAVCKCLLFALFQLSTEADHYDRSSACFAGNWSQSTASAVLLQVGKVESHEFAQPQTKVTLSSTEGDTGEPRGGEKKSLTDTSDTGASATPDALPSTKEDARILDRFRNLFVGNSELRTLCGQLGTVAIKLADGSCVDPGADINRMLLEGVLKFQGNEVTYPVKDAVVNSTCSAEDAKKLAICVCVRNEEDFIAEFIQWHRLLGVGHFYVYNDESTDRTQDILEKFSKDAVTIINTQWQNIGVVQIGQSVQMNAFTDCARNYGHKHAWLGFLDADEFVQPMDGGLCLFPFLQGMQEGKASSVQLNWATGVNSNLSFNSAGEKTLVEQIGFDGAPNMHSKSFCRPECIDSITNPHLCNLKATPGTSCKAESINTDGKVISRGDGMMAQLQPAMSRFRILHYFVRPFQGWLRKKMRGHGTTNHPKQVDSFGLSKMFSQWQIKLRPESIEGGIADGLSGALWPNKARREAVSRLLSEKLTTMLERVEAVA